MSAPQLTMTPDNWVMQGPDGYPEAWLLGSVEVSCMLGDQRQTVLCHIEAIEVVDQVTAGGNIQVAAHDDYQSTLDGMPEGRFDTIELLPGRKYVLLMVPFSA